MISLKVTLAVFWIGLWSTTIATAAVMEDLPRNGVTHLNSPDGHYEAALLDTDHPYEYWLTITKDGRLLARHHFEGELSSSFWSPDGRYLVINNHYGHRAWHVWVIKLHTGAIIHAAGLVKARNYDAYLDNHDLPNIATSAENTLQRLAPGVDDYCQNSCAVSIAYGWKNDGKLLVFTEAVSDTLADKEDSKVWLTSICRVTSRGMKIGKIGGEKVKMDAEYPSGIGTWFP